MRTSDSKTATRGGTHGIITAWQRQRLPLMLGAMVAAGCDPLVGTWQEEVSISCDDPTQTFPGEFEELIFRDDGTFRLTWYPFEFYVDYWGSYVVEGDRLTMQVEHGNYVPEGLDLEGTFAVQPDGSIRLEGMYFGQPYSPDEPSGPVTCGYVIDHY